MTLPTICIITDAHKSAANRVWEAMGRGPGTFSIPIVNDPAATWDSPATHWLMADDSAMPADVAAWQALQRGDLPPVPAGVVWGENGVIDAASAMAAVTASNLQVYSASGDVQAAEHMAGILAGRGLYKRAPPPA